MEAAQSPDSAYNNNAKKKKREEKKKEIDKEPGKKKLQIQRKPSQATGAPMLSAGTRRCNLFFSSNKARGQVCVFPRLLKSTIMRLPQLLWHKLWYEKKKSVATMSGVEHWKSTQQRSTSMFAFPLLPDKSNRKELRAWTPKKKK